MVEDFPVIIESFVKILSFSFSVASGNITSSVSPNLEFYVVDDTVTLECIAIVGNSQLVTFHLFPSLPGTCVHTP